MSLHLQSLDFPIHQNSNFRKMAYRIDFPIARCPSTRPLFAAAHHRKHLFTSNLAPTSTSNLRISSTFHSNKKLRNSSKVRSRILSVSGATTTEQMPVTEGRMLVFVPPHPLIKHWVSILRNEQTPPPVFRSAMGELGRLLIYEASRDWLPTITGEIQSPMGVASVEFVDPREPVAIVPILRAGLALAEHASSVLPATKTYHLGMSRDEETLQPSVYLNKLPDEFADGSRVIILDPMLATGGTIVAALELITNLGVDYKHIKVVCALAAPPALNKLSEKFPGLHVYAGMIDPEVNEKGFIIPGFGDAGDRSFAT